MRSPKSDPVTGPGDADLDKKGLAARAGILWSMAPSIDDGTSLGGLGLLEPDPSTLAVLPSDSMSRGPSVATAGLGLET